MRACVEEEAEGRRSNFSHVECCISDVYCMLTPGKTYRDCAACTDLVILSVSHFVILCGIISVLLS